MLPVELYNLIGETTSTGSSVSIARLLSDTHIHSNEIIEMAIEVENEQLYSLARTIITELIDDVFDDVAYEDGSSKLEFMNESIF